VQSAFDKLIALGDDRLLAPEHQRTAEELFDGCESLPARKNYEHREPSDLSAIRNERGSGPRKFARMLPDAVIKDRIHGAWLGRCIGCMLGKPIEGIHRDDLFRFLKATGQYPLRDYIAFARPARKKLDPKDTGLVASHLWYDAVTDHMPVDDDTNYTTTGLLVLEQHGATFTPVDVAFFWMRNIPLLSTCTAERIAYRNFSHQIQPPASATWRNPYREWIGAQIRADAFGYACAGDPERGAELAWRDASISHVKNGIYGEMLMAALIAAAPYAKDMRDLLLIGLSEIPAQSRLHQDIEAAMQWHASGMSYDDAATKVHERWIESDPHDWCHTNSNAVICALALLYGNGDFGESICKAVQACFDTDCNGATVGSIMGMMLGTKGVPAKWARRIKNTLHTSLQGNTVVKIDAMAERTFAVYKKMQKAR